MLGPRNASPAQLVKESRDAFKQMEERIQQERKKEELRLSAGKMQARLATRGIKPHPVADLPGFIQ